MADPTTHRATYLVSDYGEGGFDRETLGIGGDSEAIPGCLCCTGLENALSELARLGALPSPDRPNEIFIETSGLTDLAILLAEFAEESLMDKQFSIQSITTLVDAASDMRAVSKQQEWQNQVAVADICALSHLDEIRADLLESALHNAQAALARFAGPSTTLMATNDTTPLLVEMRKPRPDVDRLGKISITRDLVRHAAFHSTVLEIAGSRDLSDVIAFVRALLCLNSGLTRLKIRVSAADKPGMAYLVQVVAGRLQRIDAIADPKAAMQLGMIYLVDTALKPAAVQPLAHLFLGPTWAFNTSPHRH